MKKLILLLLPLVCVVYSQAQISEDKQLELAARTAMSDQPGEAIAIYQSALEKAPYNADLHFNIGVAYYNLGQLTFKLLF